jgi:hypothetical protein
MGKGKLKTRLLAGSLEQKWLKMAVDIGFQK